MTNISQALFPFLGSTCLTKALRAFARSCPSMNMMSPTCCTDVSVRRRPEGSHSTVTEFRGSMIPEEAPRNTLLAIPRKQGVLLGPSLTVRRRGCGQLGHHKPHQRACSPWSSRDSTCDTTAVTGTNTWLSLWSPCATWDHPSRFSSSQIDALNGITPKPSPGNIALI